MSDKDLTQLTALCKERFDEAIRDEPDSSLYHYIYEEAMSVCLGKDVWKRIEVGRKNYQKQQKLKEIERLQKEIDDAD